MNEDDKPSCYLLHYDCNPTANQYYFVNRTDYNYTRYFQYDPERHVYTRLSRLFLGALHNAVFCNYTSTKNIDKHKATIVKMLF